MDEFVKDIKNQFKKANIVLRFIYANVAVYLLFALLGVAYMLFNRSVEGVFQYLAFPSSFMRFLTQPWSIITYMFMHAGFFHLLFNMLWLYWFGQIFLRFFSAVHLRGLYFLGGMCGGLLYMFFYNVFPYFSSMVESAILVGASASVLAIVMATAYREPNYPIRLFIFGSFPLKYLAIFMVVSDLLFMTSTNAGGHIAHIGGALAGFWFAASLPKGKDRTRWVNIVIDTIVHFFSTPFKLRKKKPKMKIHKGKRQMDYDYNEEQNKKTGEVDRILEKLKKSGYVSLTEEEKKSLFDASKK